MGLSASQGRLLLLTARQNDLEYQAQQISQQRLALSAKLDDISQEYQTAISNRQMMIALKDADEKRVTLNLTYANLVSGAAALGTSSGLNQVDGVNTSDNTNSVAYRLKMGDTIVVSSIEEIPGEAEKVNSKTTKGKDKDLGIQIYTEKETKTSNQATGTTTASKKYFALEDIKDSDLAKAASSDKLATNCTVVTDDNKYYIKYGDNYYDLSGKTVGDLSDAQKKNLHEYTYDNGANSKDKVHFVYNTSSLPKNQTDTTVRVGDKTYLVDENLAKDGSGINYLQNCLRNGKYTIEKYISNEKTQNGDSWTGVAWDAATNISDQYYEDDDAEAKAKYDRLSKQVEAQDKKLQLDLDNIETQRDAVKTEKDSVQTVINDNIEKTFDTFG